MSDVQVLFCALIAVDGEVRSAELRAKAARCAALVILVGVAAEGLRPTTHAPHFSRLIG
ncbi:hypothetical protein [Bradyrhizobium sp. B120]|uniref:hypothetical protein n=1 Tax=Bradyrhizobium sp. B120 TaxID=3410088 RepID=UPI003B98197D